MFRKLLLNHGNGVKARGKLYLTEGLNNPKGSRRIIFPSMSSRTAVQSWRIRAGKTMNTREFFRRKNLGKSCKDFLFKPC